jgi:hypothetical protein
MIGRVISHYRIVGNLGAGGICGNGFRCELLRHTSAQLVNECRSKILSLPSDPVYGRNSDALGHNRVSCGLESFCRSVESMQERTVFFPDLIHGESISLGSERRQALYTPLRQLM